MSTTIITLLVLGGILVYIWNLYNGMVTAREQIKEAWSGIDVQLKRRANLIPNLVEAVKGYAKHEKTVFESVTKARSQMLSAKTPAKAAAANNMLTDALKSLFAVAEAYPKLQASTNFKDLQRQLEDTEDKVAFARQFYNTNVLGFNTKVKVFPNVVVASTFGFKPVEFFETSEEERKAIKVKF